MLTIALMFSWMVRGDLIDLDRFLEGQPADTEMYRVEMRTWATEQIIETIDPKHWCQL